MQRKGRAASLEVERGEDRLTGRGRVDPITRRSSFE